MKSSWYKNLPVYRFLLQSYDARDYHTRVVTSIIYISLIIIGSFFMLNLVLGVLSG